MKLIIDIPKRDYKLICNKKENAITAHDTCRRIADGISLKEELEKIKTEIEEINKSNDSMYCVGVTNALIILDKYISELDGENIEARWIWDWSESYGCPKYTCSECGEVFWEKTDNCPSCNAKMIKEKING